MHRIYSGTLTLVFAASVGAAAQTPQRPTQPPAQPPAQTQPGPKPADKATKALTADTEFAQKASEGGKKEVEGAKLAAGKATNAQVKALANRLVRDHTAANQELARMIKAKQISEADPATTEPEAWRNETGAAFDRAFIDAIIEDHQKDIALFEQQATSGTDAQLKAWASKKLPTLKAHLKAAEDLKARLSTTTR